MNIPCHLAFGTLPSKQNAQCISVSLLFNITEFHGYGIGLSWLWYWANLVMVLRRFGWAELVSGQVDCNSAGLQSVTKVYFDPDI